MKERKDNHSIIIKKGFQNHKSYRMNKIQLNNITISQDISNHLLLLRHQNPKNLKVHVDVVF